LVLKVAPPRLNKDVEESVETRHKNPIVLLFFAIVMCVVLYVFSVGPVALLIKTTRASHSTIDMANKVYAPLIWLDDHTFLKGPLDVYVHFWDGR
jgi:hypothetical protein